MTESAIQVPCPLSARQAWHDVYFIPTPDKLEILQQHSTLGATISQIIFERAYDKATRKHIIVGSHETITAKQSPSKKPPGLQKHLEVLVKVRRCIQQLPENVQLFGHYCYGPFTDEVRDQLFELVAGDIYSQVKAKIPEKLNTQRRQDIAMGLVQLLLADHRKTAFGAESDYVRKAKSENLGISHPYSVASFCDGLEGKGLEVRKKDWGRDVSHLYLVITEIMNTVERYALENLLPCLSISHRY